MNLGELIREYRNKNGLTMDGFAEKSGLSKSYISVLEKNKHPKTVKGNRTIEYPSYVIEAAQSVEGNSLISVSPHAIYKRYKHMLSRAGLPSYTFHALLHYGASLLMSQGFPIDYIMERGGWESRDVLERIYTHTMDSVRNKLNDKLMKALEELK